jgi:hypothetical protein
MVAALAGFNMITDAWDYESLDSGGVRASYRKKPGEGGGG